MRNPVQAEYVIRFFDRKPNGIIFSVQCHKRKIIVHVNAEREILIYYYLQSLHYLLMC